MCTTCPTRANFINPLTSNDDYNGRTVPLTSKRYILYIYSTNIGTEYFKHGIYSPFFFSSKCSLFHNSNIFGSCLIHILYTGCAKIKKNNSGAKRLKPTQVKPYSPCGHRLSHVYMCRDDILWSVSDATGCGLCRVH